MNSAGAKSVISNDMQELREGQETISNTVRGHKANISNPSISATSRYWITLTGIDTSEQSKEESRQIIDALGGDVAHYGSKENPSSKSAAENLSGSRAMNE